MSLHVRIPFRKLFYQHLVNSRSTFVTTHDLLTRFFYVANEKMVPVKWAHAGNSILQARHTKKKCSFIRLKTR